MERERRVNLRHTLFASCAGYFSHEFKSLLHGFDCFELRLNS